nr:calcyon neuron-specific vesicular protein isoform X2 [Misgurnus anguillicaudatus]
MVKLGSNLVEKVERQGSLEDGFDNIPLITPLEVNQLQQSFPDKVIVKTTTEYQLKEKKRKLYVPSTKNLNINHYDELPKHFMHSHCKQEALEMYYPDQVSRGSLYTAMTHLNQAKRNIPELSSPWLPLINALKEGQRAKGEGNH